MKVRILAILNELFNDAYNLAVGAVLTLFGYFAPVRETIHILFFFFLLDVIFGYLVARKMRGEKWQPKIIWEKTMIKMLVASLMVITAHLLDKIAPSSYLTIREFVGWFISGVVLSSVWENFHTLTKWKIIVKLNETLKEKLKFKNTNEADEKNDESSGDSSLT